MNDSAKSALLRGSAKPITNLLSSFGSPKETNISAFLGYLISLKPEVSEKIFGIQTPIINVFLEYRSEDGANRYDIVIENAKKTFHIEVKLLTHSADQLHRYQKSIKNLIIIGENLQFHLVNKSLHNKFYTWDQVVKGLQSCKATGRNKDIYFDRLVDDFILHLKENNMIKETLKDIYLRDLSGDSVEWYFNKQVFFTQAKFYDGAKSSRFFAPYLTASNRKGERHSVFKSMGVGLSYISKIEDRAIGTPKELRSMMLAKKWTKKEIDEVFKIQKWKDNTRAKFAVLFLGEPMRLFQRPVTKVDLWGVVTGAMPSISIDFGDLIAASNGLIPLSSTNRKKRKQKQ